MVTLVGVNEIERVGRPGPEALPLEGKYRSDYGVAGILGGPVATFLDLGAETEGLEFGESLAPQLPPVVDEERAIALASVVVCDLRGEDGLADPGGQVEDAARSAVDGGYGLVVGCDEVGAGLVPLGPRSVLPV